MKPLFHFSEYLVVEGSQSAQQAAEFFGFDPSITRVELAGMGERGPIWHVYPPEATS